MYLKQDSSIFLHLSLSLSLILEHGLSLFLCFCKVLCENAFVVDQSGSPDSYNSLNDNAL